MDKNSFLLQFPNNSYMKKEILLLFLLSIVLLSGCTQTPEEWFQTGNAQAVTKFNSLKSERLEDNRIGDMWVLDKDVDPFAVSRTNDLGLKWVRISFDWFDWDEVADNGEYSTFEINSRQKGVIEDLDSKGVNIVYTLLFWDEEIQPESEEYSRFKTEDEIERYIEYVRFIVGEIKDHVDYYEILNEQNHNEGTQQKVGLDDYVNLVKRVAPIIREEDPGAKVIAGSVSDSRQEEPRQYLLDFIESDAMPIVDGISFHPMYGTSPEYEIHEQFYYDYPSFIQQVKNTASANGFTGEYIVEELVWRTPRTSFPDEPWEYSNAEAAKYYARGIVINLGLDMAAGIAGEEYDHVEPIKTVIKNLCTAMAGATPTELEVEIQSDATNIRTYSFTLSNGDKLIALWTDGVAVDNNPGVSASITLPISIQSATGIDVLEGYTQPLTTEGNSIGNLIIRDYPTIIKLN